MKQRARQSGKANERRVTEVVTRALDETEVDHIVTKVNAQQLRDEIVAALLEAGAVIPDATEPTVGPKGGAGDSGASGRIIIEPGAIVINNPRPDVQAVFPRRNISRYFR